MIKKLKEWWSLNRPRITTNKIFFTRLIKLNKEAIKVAQIRNSKMIKPVINDLEKLRANTWDQDKITFMQEYLRNEFEVKDEN